MHANPFVTRPPAAMSLSYGWLTTARALRVGVFRPERTHRLPSNRQHLCRIRTAGPTASSESLCSRCFGFTGWSIAARLAVELHEMMAMLLKAKPEGGGRWIAKPPRGARMARRTSTMRLPPLAGRIWVRRMRRYSSAIEERPRSFLASTFPASSPPRAITCKA